MSDKWVLSVEEPRDQANISSAFDQLEALAAKLEHMNSVIHSAVMHPVAVSYGSSEAEELQDLRDMLSAAADVSPSDALRKRDARVAAETLEDMAWQVGGMHPKASPRGIATHITMEARKLREKIEE